MSDAPAQEPTMEEILASIRRIISEDEQPQAEPAPAAAAAPAAATPAAQHTPEPAPVDDVLELTDKVEPEPEPAAAQPGPEPEPAPSFSPPQSIGDLDVSERPPSSSGIEQPIMSTSTAETAAAAFGQLAQSVAMPDIGRSLEDVVRELLRPMLKEWLDQYLPKIVERHVQLEVERVSRGRGY